MSKRSRSLAYYAYYDQLTGLPNKRRPEELISEEADGRSHGKRALLVVNCRNFKLINSLFGYKYGDQVLREIADSLSVFCSDNRQLFHLTADRFAFLVRRYECCSELAQLCEEIMDSLTAPLMPRLTGAAIGVVEIGDSVSDSDYLLRNASLAANQWMAASSSDIAFSARR